MTSTAFPKPLQTPQKTTQHNKKTLAEWILSFETKVHPRIFYAFLYLLWPWIRGKNHFVSTQYGPIKMEFNLLDAAERQGFLHTYDRPLTNTIKSLCPVGGCFVDIGANVGILSVEAAAHVGINGFVLSVEPNPVLCERLRTMCTQNPLNNIHIVEAAAGTTQGTMPFYVSYSGLTSSHTVSSLIQNSRSKKSIPVHVLTLSDILNHIPKTRAINMLKIDAEGLDEAIMLHAVENIIQRDIRVLIVETSLDDTSASTLIKTYQPYGYIPYAVHETTFELKPWGSIQSANRNLVLQRHTP